jgi:ABC-type sugar transport system ATPase subunit/ribose/xylose/arabinose/galactoside ABC-type transport system permease subunit
VQDVSSKALFELQSVTKTFGGVRALAGVDFEVRSGEIVGLVGENGAGKSTLINLATGVHRPDSGTIRFRGETFQIAGPHDAVTAGIAVVHQEAEFFADLPLVENMLLGPGFPSNRVGWIDWRKARELAEEALSEMRVDLPVRFRARNLSVGQRVMTQIASALHTNASVLFLDEPTASLTATDSAALFERVRMLRDRGVGIVYVSHRLEEVLDLCDRIAVLRDGERVWTKPARGLEREELIEAMVGRKVTQYFPPHRSDPGESLLRIEKLTDPTGAFSEIDLEVRRGEILGLYGLVGAGRSELAQAVFGLRKADSGEVRIAEDPFQSRSPGTAMRHGIAYLPEDRLTQGVFRNLSVRENATVSILKRISRATFVSARLENQATAQVLDRTRVKAESPEIPISNLSGGNQQKVVIGRWLGTEPEILILDEPTRGVDVGAKAEIHQLIGNLAEQRKAILLISSELLEVLAMSDRVAVLCEGRIAGEFDPKTDSAETIATAAFPKGGKEPQAERSPTLAATARRFDFARFREAGIGVALIGIMAVLAVLRPETFPTWDNLRDVLSSVSILAVMALGATFAIGCGGIDISVGSMLGLLAALSGMAAVQGIPVALILPGAVLLGALLGALNMGLSLVGRVHPIIVTLAGLSIYRGVMRQATGGYEISAFPDPFRAIAEGRFLGLPGIVWVSFAVLLMAWAILQRSVWGRQLLAVGNSKTAAALMGLPAKKLQIGSFALNGAFIGLAAVLWGAYYGKVQSNTGDGWELQAIAAAVIGGCNIMGGSGTALGTFLGACLIGVVNNGLSLLQIETYWQPVFIGFFILGTVLVDGWLIRGGGRGAR